MKVSYEPYQKLQEPDEIFDGRYQKNNFLEHMRLPLKISLSEASTAMLKELLLIFR